MRHLFDSMAEVYDGHMVRGLKYPKQIADPGPPPRQAPESAGYRLQARAFWACASGA